MVRHCRISFAHGNGTKIFFSTITLHAKYFNTLWSVRKIVLYGNLIYAKANNSTQYGNLTHEKEQITVHGIEHYQYCD